MKLNYFSLKVLPQLSPSTVSTENYSLFFFLMDLPGFMNVPTVFIKVTSPVMRSLLLCSQDDIMNGGKCPTFLRSADHSKCIL